MPLSRAYDTEEEVKKRAERQGQERDVDAAHAPPEAGASDLATLQRSLGNAGVARLVQASREASAEGLTPVSPDVQRRIDAQHGSGRELDAATQAAVEPAIGAESAKVRLHDDDASSQLAARLNAVAFTQGHDVFLGAGVDTASPAGRETLAHELTHVAQARTAAGAVRRQAGKEDEVTTATTVVAEEAPAAAATAANPRTKAEAIAMVEDYVVPKDCFVWFMNNKTGWGPIPGTPCAHWVAHELGMNTGTAGSNGCDLGCLIRVSDVIAGKTKYAIADATVGDIWENPTNSSHVGLVRNVETKDGVVTKVEVEHDSSGQKKVAKNWFTTGDFYR